MLKNLINRLYRHKENISLNEMFEIVKNNSNAIVLDVRSTQEYKEGHVNRKHKYSGI